MEKVLILLAVVIGLASCSDDNQVTMTRDEYKKLTRDSTANTLDVGEGHYSILRGSDGHQYYMVYIATGGYTGHERPFHLPSCDLCRKTEIMKIKLN